jgi:hypothetical protein
LSQSTRLGEAGRAGDADRQDAANIRDSGGRDFQDSLAESGRGTAAADQKNSWGNVLGNAVESGITEGLETFGSELGNAAAGKVTDKVFGPKVKDPPPSPEPGNGESTGTDPASPGGGTSTGKTSDDSDKTSDGDAPEPTAGGETVAPPEPPPTAPAPGDDRIGLTGVTENTDGTVTARFACGYSIRTKPPPPPRCPICSKQLESTTPVAPTSPTPVPVGTPLPVWPTVSAPIPPTLPSTTRP